MYLRFTGNGGAQPEVFLVYRVLAYKVSGLIFSHATGLTGSYGFGTYGQGAANKVGLMSSAGSVFASVNASYDAWHVADVYYGSSDGFVDVDNGTSAANFQTSGKYTASALTNIQIGGAAFPNHDVPNLIGEVLIFNAKLSDADRARVRAALMSKWGLLPKRPVSDKLQGFLRDDEGWYLILSYSHGREQGNDPPAPGTPPTSLAGYSHAWLSSFGVSVDSVEAVRFFCNSSAHDRVVHFKTQSSQVRSAVVTGSIAGNSVGTWTSGVVKFADHTAHLPDATTEVRSTDLLDFPFWQSGRYHWGIYGDSTRFECDDMTSNGRGDTLHQIWVQIIE